MLNEEVPFRDESSIIFGEYGKLKDAAILAPPQIGKYFYEELLKTEHAILIGFVWFVMSRKGNYVFELPKIDLAIPYDCNELIEGLKNQFLWSGIDPIMPGEYINEQTLASGYIRLRIPKLHFSIVDIYLSLCGGSGDSDLSDYEQRAKELARKETYKVLEILKRPLPYLEEPEGREEEIERIITKQNLYEMGYNLRPIDPETETPLISDEEYERQKAEDLAKAKKIINRLIGLGYKPSFVFVDPRLIEKEGKEIEYRKAKETLKNEYGWDILKSSNNLLDEFVKKEMQNEVKDQWREVVDNVFSGFETRLKKNNEKEFLKCEAEIGRQICCWSQLADLSKIHLSTAEFLFNQLKAVEAKDFSAAVLLYCKSLENEIREKLFGRFALAIREKHKDFRKDFEEDLKGEDTKIFAGAIADCPKGRSPLLELGKMAMIFKLAFKETEESLLRKEFKQFVIEHFEIDSIPSFWEKIFDINEYRKKSAHPNGILSQKEIEECRKKVSIEIDRFIMNCN